MGKSVGTEEQSSQGHQRATISLARSKTIKKKPLKPSPANVDLVVSESNLPEMEDDGELLRAPLSEVVADCVKRWFDDTLKEAKAGDISMQVLAGQMYYNGYGVPKDAKMGRIWFTRASRVRSSVWKVSKKRPGYNASDSDSDELPGEC